MRTGHNDTEDPAGRQGGDSQTGVTGLYQHAVPPCPNYNPHAELLEALASPDFDDGCAVIMNYFEVCKAD